MNRPGGSAPDIPSYKLGDDSLSPPVSQSVSSWDGGSKKIIVPEYPDIAGMFNKIRYVQPCPLPQHIDYLVQAGLRGLDFVKIPTDPSTEQYYLRSSIIKLIELCGLRHNDIEELIDRYQELGEELDAELDAELDTSSSVKTALCGMFQTARYYCDRHNIEFL